MSLFFVSCMPEENLPIRNVGEIPDYFIECYCKPGEYFALAATTVLPVSEDLEIDFTKELSVTIFTDQEIKLFHALYTLPGSEFIYNYGTEERLLSQYLDSLRLIITTPTGEQIKGVTTIPPAISIQNCQLNNDEATISFYTSDSPKDNYYIYSAEAIHNDSIISKEICYLDYSEYTTSQLVQKAVLLSELEKAEKILFSLKRITRENYDYQISLSAANTANQSSITTPVPLKGNLKGALGIFTCYTEDQTVILPE